MRFTECVTFSLTDSALVQIKDDYEGAFKPVAPTQTHPSGLGSVAEEQSTPIQSGLQVRIAATHSGIITRNNGFYLPDKMRKGATSFTDNFPKPVLLHHEDHHDPVGRVIASRYMDTSGAIQDKYAGMLVKDRFGKEVGTITDQLLEDFISGRMPFGAQVDVVRTLLKDSLLEDTDYEGLGHIQIVANITDREAIQKLLDGRYLTGSVGATTDKAVCSVCRQDWTDAGPCEHKPGGVYDGAKCFIIAGSLSYDEYSFVNVPADRHSKIIQLNYNGVQDNVEVLDDYSGRIYEVRLGFPQYDSVQSKEGGSMKLEDAKTPEEQAPEEVTDSTAASESQTTEQATEETASTETEVQDEAAAPETTDSTPETEVEDSAEKDWGKLAEEMEQYASELDGEDFELEITDETPDMEEVEDAKKPQDRPGGSNVGKYKKGPFCGPSGGAPAGSYPVNTAKRAKAALAYARHAPNPGGIKKCVCKHYPSLPSCGKSKDSFLFGLTDEELSKLPKSAFCNPKDSTFPVTNCDQYFQALEALEDYEGEDKEMILQNAKRKGKAMGCKSKKKKDEVEVEEPEAPPVEDKVLPSPDFKKAVEQINKELEEGIDDPDLRALAATLARMFNTDAFDALKEQDLAIAPECHNAVLDEVVRLEELVGKLRDDLAAVRKEYTNLYSDVELLQDELVAAKEGARKSKEGHLAMLVALKDQSTEGKDWSEFTDESLDAELKRLTDEVDMNQITDKLGDGMSREPTEEVESPVDIQDENNQKRELSARELQDFEEQYWALKFRDSETAEKFRVNQIKRWVMEGKLPQSKDE